MPGLGGSDSGLAFGEGLIWLADGLGGATLIIQAVPPTAMDTETGDEMFTELGVIMETE
jgi:hypothetical protein